jgi:hypothetical protein
MTIITDDQVDKWFTTYKPIDNPYEDMGFDGKLFETYGRDWDYIANQPTTKVWTWVDGDYGTYIVSGCHLVNRIGYFVCEVESDGSWQEYQVERYEDETVS